MVTGGGVCTFARGGSTIATSRSVGGVTRGRAHRQNHIAAHQQRRENRREHEAAPALVAQQARRRELVLHLDRTASALGEATQVQRLELRAGEEEAQAALLEVLTQ